METKDKKEIEEQKFLKAKEVQELIDQHILKEHRDLEKSLVTMREIMVQHSEKIAAMDKELAMFGKQLSEIQIIQKESHSAVMAFSNNLPVVLENHRITQEKNINEKLEGCRKARIAETEKSFFKIPEGFWGNLFKFSIIVIGLGGSMVSIGTVLKLIFFGS